MKLPFWVYPKHWGLSGTELDLARARFYCTGHELETRLIIYRDDLTDSEKYTRSLAVDLKYNKITKFEHDIRLIEKNEALSDIDKELKKNDLRFEHNLISDKEHKKNEKTINKKPWVNIQIEMNDNDPLEGQIAFEWNQYMIEFLHANGYLKQSDDDTIDAWMTDWCRVIALNNIRGALSEEEFDELSQPTIKKVSKDGRSEYS